MLRMLQVSLIILLLPSYFACSQTITGQVLDEETEKIVPFANVYFNSTFRGTAANENGEFALKIGPYYGQAIVVSSVGYESAVIEEYDASNFYKVMLKPKKTVLEEVTVEPDNMLRKKKERIFIEEFLGQSENALSCEIENLNEVRLIYASSSDRLEAYADVPIIIQNKALGYRIEYYLVQFTSDQEATYYKGNFFFEETDSLHEKEVEKIKKVRKATYLGSRMHFFRSLWSKSFWGQGFRLTSVKEKDYLTYRKVVIEHEGQKFLTTELINLDTTNIFEVTPTYDQTENAIKIRYSGSQITEVNLRTSRVYFNSNGYFDPDGISWSGKMANERIGDLLPFDYNVKE